MSEISKVLCNLKINTSEGNFVYLGNGSCQEHISSIISVVFLIVLRSLSLINTQYAVLSSAFILYVLYNSPHFAFNSKR